MGNNIKGITVEIGGNTGPLSSAMKEVNKTAGDLQSELREVNKQLKFDPQNTNLLTQKMDLLKQSSQALEEKQKTLKTAVEQAHAAFEKGELGADKVRAVEREYEKVNSQLQETKKDLAAAEAESGNFVEKVKGKFSQLKDKIKETFSAENIKAGIGAVGVAVGGFLKGSLDEAKDAEKANADLEQTLKSTKGAAGMTMQSLEGLSQAMVNNTTFSNDEVKAGEGMLLTFTNIGKNVFPQATAALLDMSQKMGTDTKTQAMQLGKALNDPVKGITALTRVGVTFTDQQKQQIAAMQKAGDTAGAQKIILAELNKEFGGQAAAAAETYDGKQKQIANTMKEIKETIGTALIPVLASLSKLVAPIIQAVGNFVSQNPQLTAAILAIIAVVGTLVGGLSLFNTVMTAFGLIMGASVAPTAAAGAAAGGAAVGFGSLLLPIILVTAAIAALAAGAVLIVTHWSQISAFFVNLWNTIKNAFSGMGDWFKNTFQSARDGAQSAWNGAGNWFAGVGNSIKNAFNSTIEWIKTNWKSLALFLVNPIAGVVSLLYNNNPKFKAWADNLMNSIKTSFSNGINSIRTFFTGIWNWIQIQILMQETYADSFFNRIKTAVLSIWTPIQNGLMQAWNGIKTAASGAWNLIKNIVMAPVLLLCDLITGNFKQVGSDLQLIWSNIKNAASTIWNGLTQIFTGVWTAISGSATAFWSLLSNGFSILWNGITGTITTVWNNVYNFFTGIWNKIITVFKPDMISGGFKTAWAAIQNAWNGVGEWFKGVWEAIISHFKPTMISDGFKAAWSAIQGAWKSAGDWFKGIWDAIKGHFKPDMISTGFSDAWGAIKSAWGGVGDWFKGIWDSIKSGFTSLNPFEWGKDLLKSFIDGIKSKINDLKNAVGNVGDAVRKVLHHSHPDEGPLADDYTWMPDMMETLRGGILSNIGRVSSAASQVASAIAGTIPSDLSSSVQVRAALAAAGGYSSVPSARTSAAASQAVSASQISQPINLTLVTPDGQTVGKFVAPYVGKELEFNSKSLLPSKG